LDWVSGKVLAEGVVGTDALALELEEFVVFGDFVPAYSSATLGLAVAESICGAGPDDAGAGVDPFEVDPSLCVFREIWTRTEGRQTPHMAMQAGLKFIIINRLSTNKHGCYEALDFRRLTALLAKTVKKANKTHSDGSG